MDTNRWDFSGWATKNNIRCSDGRVIRKDAFKECDGHTVPLVWNHQHNDPNDILGHARLENREEGVYAYCSFNDSENAKSAKEAVKHGDVAAMSIFANQLKQQGSNVIHGAIREVSLVLAGANPGAFIESIICHNDEGNYDEESDEAVIYTGEKLDLYHAEDQAKNSNSDNEETIGDVFNTLTEKQKNVVYAMIAEALDSSDGEDDEEDDDDLLEARELPRLALALRLCLVLLGSLLALGAAVLGSRHLVDTPHVRCLGMRPEALSIGHRPSAGEGEATSDDNNRIPRRRKTRRTAPTTAALRRARPWPGARRRA